MLRLSESMRYMLQNAIMLVWCLLWIIIFLNEIFFPKDSISNYFFMTILGICAIISVLRMHETHIINTVNYNTYHGFIKPFNTLVEQIRQKQQHLLDD